MKIQLVTSYYTPFVNDFLLRHTKIEDLSYNELLNLVLSEFFAETGSSYYWLKNNFQEVFLSISNFEVLQKKWAVENNVTFDDVNWKEQILLAQAKYFKPDVFYTESIIEHSSNLLTQVSDTVKLMVAWVSFPFDTLPNASFFKLILTSTKDYRTQFIAQGINSEYMLPAFDTRVIDHIGSVKKKINFSFVGGISSVHKNRWEALNYLCKNTELKVWGYGLPPKEQGFINRIFKKDSYATIRKHHHGEAWGLHMYSILASSYITFNIHEALLKGDVGNMRMFEATGIGAMLLNDHGHNINELFIPDKEIVTYKSLPEALEKYRFYMANKEKAIEIGQNAAKRTREMYNYNNYAITLIDILKKYLK